MATFYVRKTGNDASAGTSAGTAWLTLGKALGAAGIGSGDTLYIGAGVYRQAVTVAMTSAVAETFIIGDVDGAQTGDAGEVRLTSYTTSDTAAPAATATLTLAGRDHLTFDSLTFHGGNATDQCIDATTATSTDIKFVNCAFLPGAFVAHLIHATIGAGVAANWTIDRCSLFGGATAGIRLTLNQSGLGSDYDTNIQISNTLIVQAVRSILVESGGAGANFGGGVDVANCTLIGATTAAVQCLGASLSTSIPCTAYNNVIHANGDGTDAGVLGQLLEDFNLIWASLAARTNVTAGASSKTNPNTAWLFEIGQSSLIGKLPRRHLEPTFDSPALGFGNHSGAPTVDFLNRPRPAGVGSTSSAIGYLERHDTGAREASVVDASTYSLKLTGLADHDLLIPVNAVSTTITLRARYDTNHAATNKPQAILQANGEIGVATQTVTMTAAIDTWETLTIGPFTPTAVGWVTVRLVSRSAAGNGIAYFDTITGTSIGTGNEDYWKRGEAFPAATTATGGGVTKLAGFGGGLVG